MSAACGWFTEKSISSSKQTFIQNKMKFIWQLVVFVDCGPVIHLLLQFYYYYYHLPIWIWAEAPTHTHIQIQMKWITLRYTKSKFKIDHVQPYAYYYYYYMYINKSMLCQITSIEHVRMCVCPLCWHAFGIHIQINQTTHTHTFKPTIALLIRTVIRTHVEYGSASLFSPL